jgi:hypothetical protein
MPIPKARPVGTIRTESSQLLSAKYQTPESERSTLIAVVAVFFVSRS